MLNYESIYYKADPFRILNSSTNIVYGNITQTFVYARNRKKCINIYLISTSKRLKKIL